MALFIVAIATLLVPGCSKEDAAKSPSSPAAAEAKTNTDTNTDTGTGKNTGKDDAAPEPPAQPDPAPSAARPVEPAPGTAISIPPAECETTEQIMAAIGPGEPTATYDEAMTAARQAMMKNQYGKARKSCNDALRIKPNDPAAATMCGVAACNAKQAVWAARYSCMLSPNRQAMIRQSCLKAGLDITR